MRKNVTRVCKTEEIEKQVAQYSNKTPPRSIQVPIDHSLEKILCIPGSFFPSPPDKSMLPFHPRLLPFYKPCGASLGR
jgi:hypothetical protein